MVVAMASALAPQFARAHPAGVSAVNTRPWTIPALRQWIGARGSLVLRPSLRIVVRPVDRRRLGDTARILAADLGSLLGHRPLIITGRERHGDVRLRLGSRDRRLGEEGYELTIGRTVDIRARTPAGDFYGTRSLLQLLRQNRAIPKGQARDWPRYPERGLMIDLGRRAYTPAWIRTEIRAMAYLKLNLLHLHLTDDQRWGIQSVTHPELASSGALTHADVRRLIALATRFHITVVPEIDMPGHMGALLAKHPELQLRTVGAVGRPAAAITGKLDISNPRALSIVRQLLHEYQPLFPGRYWDMGADEYLAPGELPLYPQLASFAVHRYGRGATTQDAIIGFIDSIDRIVHAHHKTLRTWHDELRPGSVLSANPDIVVDWWTNISPLSDPTPPRPDQLLASGHRIANDGWFPTYFTGDVGPVEGMPDMREAYQSWSVNQFCGPTIAGQLIGPCYVVGRGERRNLGSTINDWDNRNLTLREIAAGLYPRLRVLAQKTWDSPPLTASYAAFERVMRAVGSR